MSHSRIERIRRRYQTGVPVISIQRAKYYTQSWKETEGLSAQMRVAHAMKNVYEKMRHNLDPDDRIAGCCRRHRAGRLQPGTGVRANQEIHDRPPGAIPH